MEGKSPSPVSNWVQERRLLQRFPGDDTLVERLLNACIGCWDGKEGTGSEDDDDGVEVGIDLSSGDHPGGSHPFAIAASAS